ncbi:unnamed protein product [Arctia plantaginis]|uniref:Uncharacterized protein n=1 Tax=Arctia plantaginis TaxID=874455 RepID=A0A8S0ZB47_ARCPL|nr:unnamed protein product [Arctia plantaginis]
MVILCSANPTTTREIATTHEKRSLFRDVIDSLRIHTQLPKEININDENDLSQNYDRYGFKDEYLPSDSEFVPRRNDRIEMPSLKYRFPKSLDLNANDKIPVKEVVVHIDADATKQTTQKPKKDRINQRPTINKVKLPNRIKQNEEEVGNTDTDTDDNFHFSNFMNGQSQIGHRETQTVLKPTVIVNIRGSVNHRDSDIRLEARDEGNSSVPWQNIFNINQEVKIGKEVDRRKNPVQQEIKTVEEKDSPKPKEHMMMCETASSKFDNGNRKFDNALQILFTV